MPTGKWCGTVGRHSGEYRFPLAREKTPCHEATQPLDSFPSKGCEEVCRDLPDLDSNQDRQTQNLLCYRYTIGQGRAKFNELPDRAASSERVCGQKFLRSPSKLALGNGRTVKKPRISR